jgi:heptosyltransferase-2
MLQAIGRQRIDKSGIRRILVRATNWVGDAVMSLPALEVVRENFPSSSITVLARPWVIPLFKNHPAVDAIIPFKKTQGYFEYFRELMRMAELIRNNGYDLAILFQNAFEAAFLAYLGRITFRVGYRGDGRGFLLTHGVVRTDEVLKVHQTEYYLALLEAMGWEGTSRDPHLYAAQEDMEKARRLLHAKGIVEGDCVIGLSPGALFGEAKRWPADRFARVGDWAAERWNARVIVLGSGNETDICEVLCSSMAHEPYNLCGQTSLGVAIGLVSHCSFFVTNDSGLMHIAAALGVPTLAVFGSTDPVATGPRGPKTSIVKHEIECAPCLKPECPTDFRCMLSIEPEEVWNEMEIMRRESE